MPLDFSRQNLRGRSFRGQNLEGANFSYADIRSADFSNANLTEAKFTGAKAGLQNRWTISLLIFSLLLEAVSGFISAVSGAAIGLCLISGDLNYLFAGVVSLVVLAVFLIVAVPGTMPVSSTTAPSDYSSSELVVVTASSTNYCKTTSPKWSLSETRKRVWNYATHLCLGDRFKVVCFRDFAVNKKLLTAMWRTASIKGSVDSRDGAVRLQVSRVFV
ncbi:hypothetical protein NIES4106_60340 (plasmid) [Fischerella sp. NIES-4106]|nr:hypothetical protein NIES4106_60340 [Fischerella sp. NIES-4106]